MSQEIRVILLQAKVLLDENDPLYSTLQITKDRFDELDSLLTQKGCRNKFELVYDDSVDLPLDKVQERFEQSASIVHFCGYSMDKTIDIRNELPEALSMILQVKGENIRCVLLIACHSQNQASTISKHVDCVIGLPREIPYKQAMQFAVNFYTALSQKMNVEKAITWGKIPISQYLKKIPSEHHPQIIKNDRVSELSEIVVLKDEESKAKEQELEILREIQKTVMELSYAATSKAT